MTTGWQMGGWRMAGQRAAMLAGACLLGACGQEQAPAAPEDGDQTEAEGEVLPGTISDEMIPYDELGRDEAPALPPPTATDEGAPPTATGSARPAASPTRRITTPAAEEPDGTASPDADSEQPAAEE